MKPLDLRPNRAEECHPTFQKSVGEQSNVYADSDIDQCPRKESLHNSSDRNASPPTPKVATINSHLGGAHSYRAADSQQDKLEESSVPHGDTSLMSIRKTNLLMLVMCSCGAELSL